MLGQQQQNRNFVRSRNSNNARKGFKPRHVDNRAPRYEDFNSPLHNQWKRDQALRRLLPLRDTWRGCLSLGALFAPGMEPLRRGKVMLYENDAVMFHAMRDVPPGHFSGAQYRRPVTYVSAARADLFLGAPMIRFNQDLNRGIDWQKMPYDAYVLPPRERPMKIVKRKPRQAPVVAAVVAAAAAVEMPKFVYKEVGDDEHADLYRDVIPEVRETIRPAGDVLDASERPREFSLFNRMSEDMTRYAFFATDEHDRPMLPAWHQSRERLYRTPTRNLAERNLTRENVEWLRNQRGSLSRWSAKDLPMPRPYLTFQLGAGQSVSDWLTDLFNTATRSEARVDALECPRCHAKHDVQLFGLHDATGWALVRNPYKVEFMSSGNARDDSVDINEMADAAEETFLAYAPCGCRGQAKDGRTLWHLSSAQPSRCSRRFTRVFKLAFCDAVAAGLPFVAARDATYALPMDAVATSEFNGQLDVTAHRFVDADKLAAFTIYAPSGISLLCKPGSKVKAGELLARMVTVDPKWSEQSLDDRWDSLHDILGGSRWVSLAQLEWFKNQAILLAGNRVALPFYLISTSADLGHLHSDARQPSGLMWDFGPLVNRMDRARTSCVLPVLELEEWDCLSRRLAYDVYLDARIYDARFQDGRYEDHEVQQQRTHVSVSVPRATTVPPIVEQIEMAEEHEAHEVDQHVAVGLA